MPNRELFALLIQEGTKIVSTLIATRRPKLPHPTFEIDDLKEDPRRPQPATAEETEGKASAIATGCVPCAIGHLSTCSGLLNEAMRFAREDEGGVRSDEVINRAARCIDELNAMEREDLRPEMTVQLPSDEKALAITAMNLSRSTRHSLEGLTSTDQLESLAANMQSQRQEIFRTWMKNRMEEKNV